MDWWWKWRWNWDDDVEGGSEECKVMRLMREKVAYNLKTIDDTGNVIPEETEERVNIILFSQLTLKYIFFGLVFCVPFLHYYYISLSLSLSVPHVYTLWKYSHLDKLLNLISWLFCLKFIIPCFSVFPNVH